MDLLNIPLDDESAYDAVESCSNDSLQYVCDQVFFFGKIIPDCNAFLYGNDEIDERKYYTICPQCGELIKLPRKPKTGDEAECLHCNADGTFFDFRDRSNRMEFIGRQKLCYVDYVKGGYVVRIFETGLDYSDRDYNDLTTLSHYPSMNVREAFREYYINGRITLYENRFTHGGVVTDTDWEPTNVIDESDAYICNNTYDYNYTDDYTSTRETETLGEAIAQFIPHKAIAALEKYGFGELLKDVALSHLQFPDSDGISNVLGVDYNRLKSGWKNLDLFDQIALETALQLKDMGIAYTESNVNIARRVNVKELLKMEHSERVKFLKYIRHQGKTNDVSAAAGDYLDYKQDCERLGYDWKDPAVRYPTNLQKAHERTSDILRSREYKKYDAGIRKAYKKNHVQVEFSDGDLSVIMAKSASEIVKEGARQSNCVASYCDRMAQGRCIIAFVRKVECPDVNYYTMELSPDMRTCGIVQCRGYKNGDPTPEDRKRIDAFLQKYKAWFNMRPLADDKVQVKAVI